MDFLKDLFGRFRWFRRFVGGHWELWYHDHPYCSGMWHHVYACHRETRRSPGMTCRGTPKCEEYETSKRVPSVEKGDR